MAHPPAPFLRRAHTPRSGPVTLGAAARPPSLERVGWRDLRNRRKRRNGSGRRRNWKFDVVGGLTYLALAHPLFGACRAGQRPATFITPFTKQTEAAELLVFFLSDTVFAAVPLLLSASSFSVAVVAGLFFVSISAVDSTKMSVSRPLRNDPDEREPLRNDPDEREPAVT